jgi:hypothetical protein
MIKVLEKTKDLQLIEQTSYHIMSIKFKQDISSHSHLKTAKKHFNELKRTLEKK